MSREFVRRRALRALGVCAVLAGGASAAAVVGGGGAAAGAAAPPPAWNCYASPINLSIGGQQPRIDPIHAGGTPCTPQTQGAGNIPGDLMIPDTLLTADTLSAVTTLDPAVALSYQQTAGATGTIEDLHLQLPPGGGGLDLRVTLAKSTAQGTCKDGTPDLTGTSQLVGLTINGNSVPIDSALQQIAAALGPLAQVLSFEVDKETRTASSIDEQALHLVLLPAGGPLVDLVAGEASVGYTGAVCAPPAGPTTVTQTTTQTSTQTQTETTTQTQTQTQTVQSPPPPPVTQTVTTPAPQQKVEAVSLKPNGTNGGCGYIAMWFDRNHRRAFAVRFGTRVVTRGLLVNCKGKPIVGAKIRVVHIVEGRRHLIKTGLRSRPGGKLTLILPLNLSTRTIEYDYLGNLNSSRVTSRVLLRLTVRDRHGRLVLVRDLKRLQGR